MTASNYLKLGWQLPLLALLCVAIVPDTAWQHSLSGAWPMWLLALSVSAFVVGKRHERPAQPARPVAQVLVLPMPRSPRRAMRAAVRKAA